MKSTNTNTYSVLSFAVATVIVMSGCQRDSTSYLHFDPREMSKTNLNAAAGNPQPPLLPLPDKLNSQYLPDEYRKGTPAPTEEPAKLPLANNAPQIKLSLREMAQRLVANNLNVKVSGYQPAIDETRVTEAEARFDPVLFSNLSYDTKRNDALQFAAQNSNTWDLTAGIRQNFGNGGKVELSVNPSLVRFNNDNVQQNQIQLQITQPLLRDFGNDINHARIIINQNNQRISALDFRKDLEEALRNIEEGYWRLVQAQREVDIQERLLQRTLDTADILYKRFPQDVTMEQISQAIQSIKTRRQARLQAAQKVADLSDQLKNLMNDPEFPVTGNTLILPADTLLESPVQFDLQDVVASALVNRYEIGQQQLRISNAQIAMRVADNNLLPQLNLVASVGTQKVGEITSDHQSPFFQKQNINWSLGLQFEYPLGNREAEAINNRARLQMMQANVSYKQLIDQVSTEVKIALREVQTHWQEMILTREARFAATERLNSIETREKANEPLTPDFIDRKLRAQEGLAEAERLEVQAIADYNVSISKLESSKGTLLRYNNIVMDEKIK